MNIINSVKNFLTKIYRKLSYFENEAPNIKWGQSSDDCCNKKCECKDYPYNIELSEHPNKKWKKSKLKEFMDINNIKYNSRDTKHDLLQKIEWGSK